MSILSPNLGACSTPYNYQFFSNPKKAYRIFSTRQASFSFAELTCKYFGGRLFMPKTKQELDDLAGETDREYIFSCVQTFLCVDMFLHKVADRWIGLTNPDLLQLGSNPAASSVDGVLKWMDGTDFAFDASFMDLEVEDGRYCFAFKDDGRKFGDTPCHYSKKFICEYHCDDPLSLRE